MLSNICPPNFTWDYIERGVVGTGILACPWSLDIFPEVQRQEAAASSESPVRAPENSPGQARGRSPSRRPGSRSHHFLLSPRIARLWAVRGERPGEGGLSLPIGESRVSLFFRCFSRRNVIFANGHGLPPHPDPLPQRPPKSGVLGGEGETRRDLDPGRRVEFLLRTLPWANVCCPFRALKGSSGVLPLLIQKMSELQEPRAEARG